MKRGFQKLLVIFTLFLLLVSFVSGSYMQFMTDVTLGNLNATKICLNGDCKTSWPTFSNNWAEASGNVYRTTGNVGIGTNNPTEALDVNGNITATGTICDSNGCIGDGSGSSSSGNFSFGTSVIKSLDTVYQAESNGFVEVFATHSGGSMAGSAYGYIGDSVSSLEVKYGDSVTGVTNMDYPTQNAHFTMIVRKGEYYKVTSQSDTSHYSGVPDVNITWIPFEGGSSSTSSSSTGSSEWYDWTPKVYQGESEVSANILKARYTQIGKVVHFHANIDVTGTGTTESNKNYWAIGNLPIEPVVLTQAMPVGIIGIGKGGTGTWQGELLYKQEGTGDTPQKVMNFFAGDQGDWFGDVEEMNSFVTLRISGSYEVDSDVGLPSSTSSIPTTCLDTELLVYNSTSSEWECGTSSGISFSGTFTGSQIFHTCYNNGTAVTGTDEACTRAQANGGLGDGSYRAISCDISGLIKSDKLIYNTNLNPNRWKIYGGSNCIDGTIIVADLEGTAVSSSSNIGGLASGERIFDGGHEHTCAIMSDQTVRCWGRNDWGQLGDGLNVRRYTPYEVSGINNAVQVSAGELMTCALLSDGTIKCWGHNGQGQLGDGTTTSSRIPVLVSGINTAVQIEVSDYRTACALLSDGTVKCWGYNAHGEIGDGTTTNRNTPVLVSGLSNIEKVDCGEYHCCALSSDSTVECWGYNGNGQLGDGTTTARKTPVPVSGLTGVTDLAAGSYHTCSILSDNTVKCWGRNGHGQLGDGTTTNRNTPVLVSGIDDAEKIDLDRGNTADNGHTCIVRTNGLAKCWGYNGYGHLSDGTETARSLPVNIYGLKEISDVNLGYGQTCFSTIDNELYCVGHNNYGQLGIGDANRRRALQKVLT